MIMEGGPFTLIEGIVIAGLGLGASRGYGHLRLDYRDATAVMRRAVEIARRTGVVGADILFDMDIRVGHGAYVGGEITSLLNSLEGKRGVVRAKPPLPALEGFLGRPTLVNDVISLTTVPVIFEKGAQHCADLGLGRSCGTLTLQVAGNVARGGVFETGFGITPGEVVKDLGGGTTTGRPVKAVQVGGPLGAYLPVSKFNAPLGYEKLDAEARLLGHASLDANDEIAIEGEGRPLPLWGRDSALNATTAWFCGEVHALFACRGWNSYRHNKGPESRKVCDEARGVKVDAKPGLRVSNVLDAAVDGTFMGLYCLGEDILQSDPDTRHVVACRHLAEEGKVRAGVALICR